MFKYKTSLFGCDHQWWMQKWQVYYRSMYKECVNVLWLQSTLNSNLCTHVVGTKQVVKWCDFALFCYLIIPKQHGFTQKNGVWKKKNSGNWHHLVKLFMFWYLTPLKTCKLVPISLNHIWLGAKQFPHRVHPKKRLELESTCDWKRTPTVFYHDPFEQ